MSSAMVLETERMWLVPWEMRDWTSFRPIAKDPEGLRYTSGGRPWSDSEIQDFVQRQIGNLTRHRFCFWRLLRKADSAFLGFCALGPATEAARATLRDGLERVERGRIIALAQPANLASIRVMEKLGMSYEREVVPKGIPVVLYSISTLRPAP